MSLFIRHLLCEEVASKNEAIGVEHVARVMKGGAACMALDLESICCW